MAGGKRKVFTKTARNKRQKEMKNTEEMSLVGESRSTLHLVNTAKFEESEEMRGKGEEIPLEVDMTTSEREPGTPIKPEQKSDEMSKNSAKYVPPFSRNKKSGNTEGESSNIRSVTRSSTRKRNLLQVLAEVAKQKLEIEDSENVGTTSLATSEKTDSHPSNMNEKEQDEPHNLKPTKKTKLTGRMKINRALSLNPKRKKKNNQKENKTQTKKEFNKDNIPFQEIPREKEVKTSKEMENEALVDDALEEESLKNSTKEKKLQKNACVEDSMPIKISNEADNFFANKESSPSKEGFIATTVAPDSMLNEMPYVETVVQACMEYLIQTVEADVSTSAATDVAVDVVANDTNMEDLDVSAKKMKGVFEDVIVSQVDNNGECSATSRHHSNDDVIDNSHTSCSYMHIDADPVNKHLMDKVDGCKTFISDDIKDNETHTKTIETLARSSSNTDNSDAHVVADSNYSDLEKLETEASHSSMGNNGGNQREKFDGEMLNNENKTGHLDDADDNYDDDDKLENKVHHSSTTNHSDDDDNDDIDVVGCDDKDHDRSHIKTLEKDVSTNHCSNDISVIDHNFSKSLESSENKLKGANKMDHADDPLVPCDSHEGDSPNTNSIKENVLAINVIHSADDGNVNNIANTSSTSQSEIRKNDSKKEADNATPAACQIEVLTASPCNDCQITKEIQTSEKAETKSTSVEDSEVHKMNCDLQQERQIDKDSTACEGSTQEKYDKHDKTNSTSEKQSSAKPSTTASLKCEGAQEMDLDYFIDCTDSQLIDSKQGVAMDGLRYEEDFNLEDLMDCTDSQLVDIENMENQASKKSLSASDPVPSQALIEDGTILIQDLIKEVSSLKHYLVDKWNRHNQDKRRGCVAFKTPVKKWK